MCFPVYWKEDSGADRAGYIDRHGKLIAEFGYLRVGQLRDKLAFFTDGARWEKGLLWGLMSEDGEVVRAPCFTSFKPFREGRAVASDDQSSVLDFRFGYLDSRGDWAIPCTLRGAYPFSEAVAYAKREREEDLWSLLDLTGQVLIDQLSLGGGYLREGLACAYVPKTKLHGYRDRTGAWKIEPRFTGAHDFFEGRAAVLNGKPGKELVSFIDHDGNVVIKPSAYVSCEQGFSEGLACVYRPVGKGEGLAGYIDAKGEEVIPCRWGLGTPFSDGLAAVMDNASRLWGYIDRKGSVVIPPQFGAVEPFTGGLASVRRNKRIGPDDYIDRSGEVIWKAGSKPKS